MKTIILPSGSKGIDTIEVLNEKHCQWLKEHGFDFVFKYLGSTSKTELDLILEHDLAVSFVTYANAWNADNSLRSISELDLPEQTDIFLDVEGTSPLNYAIVMTSINKWATNIARNKFGIGIYVGADTQLTSEELYKVYPNRYWHSCSRVTDRFGKEAGPSCGWCIYQLHPPNIKLECGLIVDIDVLQKDYLGRQVTMVIKS